MSTGRFEFLIVGDIDVLDNWNDIMTPNSIKCYVVEKNDWHYYVVGDDEFSYSIEPPGIQMTFNKEMSLDKARIIVKEILENINITGQEAEVVEIFL